MISAACAAGRCLRISASCQRGVTAGHHVASHLSHFCPALQAKDSMPNRVAARVSQCFSAGQTAWRRGLHAATCWVASLVCSQQMQQMTTGTSHPIALTLLQVLLRLMGNPPKYVRSGATIPALAAFQKHLNATTTVFAFDLPDGNLRECYWKEFWMEVQRRCRAAGLPARERRLHDLLLDINSMRLPCASNTFMLPFRLLCRCPQREPAGFHVPPSSQGLGGIPVCTRGGGCCGGCCCRCCCC